MRHEFLPAGAGGLDERGATLAERTVVFRPLVRGVGEQAADRQVVDAEVRHAGAIDDDRDDGDELDLVRRAAGDAVDHLLDRTARRREFFDDEDTLLLADPVALPVLVLERLAVLDLDALLGEVGASPEEAPDLVREVRASVVAADDPVDIALVVFADLVVDAPGTLLDEERVGERDGQVHEQVAVQPRGEAHVRRTLIVLALPVAVEHGEDAPELREVHDFVVTDIAGGPDHVMTGQITLGVDEPECGHEELLALRERVLGESLFDLVRDEQSRVDGTSDRRGRVGDRAADDEVVRTEADGVFRRHEALLVVRVRPRGTDAGGDEGQVRNRGVIADERDLLRGTDQSLTASDLGLVSVPEHAIRDRHVVARAAGIFAHGREDRDADDLGVAAMFDSGRRRVQSGGDEDGDERGLSQCDGTCGLGDRGRDVGELGVVHHPAADVACDDCSPRAVVVQEFEADLEHADMVFQKIDQAAHLVEVIDVERHDDAFLCVHNCFPLFE